VLRPILYFWLYDEWDNVYAFSGKLLPSGHPGWPYAFGNYTNPHGHTYHWLMSR
jgi:hypothetical protein